MAVKCNWSLKRMMRLTASRVLGGRGKWHEGGGGRFGKITSISCGSNPRLMIIVRRVCQVSGPGQVIPRVTRRVYVRPVCAISRRSLVINVKVTNGTSTSTSTSMSQSYSCSRTSPFQPTWQIACLIPPIEWILHFPLSGETRLQA